MKIHCNKKCYDKKGAITAKNSRWRKDHAKLRIYPCPICKPYWHLTKVNGTRGKKK